MERKRAVEIGGVLVLAAVVAAAVVVAMMRFYAPVEASPTSASVDASPTAPEGSGPAAAPTDEPVRDGPTLAPLPDGARVVFLGDRWSEGHAAAPGKGYVEVAAAELGWEPVVVPGGAGSGHVAGATYAERAEAAPSDPEVDLVVVQGGLADVGDSSTTQRMPSALGRTLTAVRATWPGAQLLVVGPLAPSAEVDAAVGEVDAVLRRELERSEVPYLSPQAEEWWGEDREEYVVPETGQPSTRGHAAFAEGLVSAVQELTTG